jgi:hypothetical protein
VSQPEYGVPQDLGPEIDVPSLDVFDPNTTPDDVVAEIGQVASSPSTPSTAAPSAPSMTGYEDLISGLDGAGASEIFKPLTTAGTNPAAQAAQDATQALALNTGSLSNLANFISTQNAAVTPGTTPYVGLPQDAGSPTAAAVPEFGGVSYPTGSTSSGSSGSGTA